MERYEVALICLLQCLGIVWMHVRLAKQFRQHGMTGEQTVCLYAYHVIAKRSGRPPVTIYKRMDVVNHPQSEGT